MKLHHDIHVPLSLKQWLMQYHTYSYRMIDKKGIFQTQNNINSGGQYLLALIFSLSITSNHNIEDIGIKTWKIVKHT